MPWEQQTNPDTMMPQWVFYEKDPDGNLVATRVQNTAPTAQDLATYTNNKWWETAQRVAVPGTNSGGVINPNTGKIETLGITIDKNGNNIGLLPKSVADAMGLSAGWSDQPIIPYKGGLLDDIGGTLLNISAASFLSSIGLTTGTPFIDKLLGGALQQLVTTGQVDPEQLAKSAAIGQLTPEIAKTVTEKTGLPANIVNAATNVGVAGAVGGAPAALSTAAGVAGSEAIKAATAQPGAAISTPTAESQPEYGTPTTPAYSEPTMALETALSTPISPLPVAETQAPAQPQEPEQFPQLKPDGTVMTPEEVAAARPDLFPGGVLPQPGEETTYFPEGGMVTAPTEVPGQLSPGDQPIYDQETGRALSPAEVAAQYPDLYPEGRLPEPGQDTVFTPPQAGVSIPSKTISQLFSLSGGGPAAYGAGVLGAATPSKEFGLAAAPSRALGQGDVEAPETGKKRRQVWNVASLRNLQDALGI